MAIISPVLRRILFVAAIASIFLYTGYKYSIATSQGRYRSWRQPGKIRWIDVKEHFPVDPKIMYQLPEPVSKLPRIQFDFGTVKETPQEIRIRETRLAAVKENMALAWNGYKQQAWLKDEVKPVSGGATTAFGGWAATLVDSLDTLWIMGFRKEFDEAVAAATTIDFTTAQGDVVNVFETTIRYLGGFLAAYDQSGRVELLYKAVELGDMLYKAFDTPNRMPVTRWFFKNAIAGEEQIASSGALLAEIGSLSLEFTRLSQLTGDRKWYDAVTRITEHFYHQRDATKIPGLFPIMMDASTANFVADTTFSLGAMADSFYEYLPKMYALLGGAGPHYKELYEGSIKAAKEHLFFQPFTQDNREVLMSGTLQFGFGDTKINDHSGQHLECYIGGMVGLAAKLFGREEQDMKDARKLTDGCIWAYEATPGTHIMSETFRAIACSELDTCYYTYDRWVKALKNNPNSHHLKKDGRLPVGFFDVTDGRYLLRPEAIESVFILYRITGDKSLRESGWKMFESIIKATRTTYGHSAIDDVTIESPGHLNSMESFWTAETLKYFYLLFSDENVISLDDYVFNTEAHPLSLKGAPKKSSWFGWS